MIERTAINLKHTVIVRLMGGLGNQLYQYAAGRAIAVRQNARLRLDASWYRGRRDRTYVLSQFQIQEDLLGRAEARMLHYWLGGRHRRAKSIIQSAVPPTRLTHVVDPLTEVILIPLPAAGTVYLDGYWQSPAYFQNAEPVLRDEFRFRSVATDDMNALAEQMQSCESVAVHVRRGDYVTNPAANQCHGLCEADYYERAARIVCERVSSPRFFVFSDDPAAARRELRLPGPVDFITGSNNWQDWDDLRLMSTCRHHIIANSSFSWWGAWLAKHEGQVVVAPQQWFQPEVMASRRLEDRIPSEWVVA